MPIKTFVCAICGKDDLTKRQSRLIDGKGRVCKGHDEAKELADKQHQENISKRNREASEASRKFQNRSRSIKRDFILVDLMIENIKLKIQTELHIKWHLCLFCISSGSQYIGSDGLIEDRDVIREIILDKCKRSYYDEISKKFDEIPSFVNLFESTYHGIVGPFVINFLDDLESNPSEALLSYIEKSSNYSKDLGWDL